MTASTTPRRRARFARVLAGRRFPLFAEMIVVSLAVAVVSLAAVTVLLGFAAGAAHLRRFAAGERDGVKPALADLWDAARRGWLWSVGVTVGAVAVAVNVFSPTMATVPGGEILRTLSLVIGAVGVVVLLRACAMWRRGDTWSPLVRAAAGRSLADPAGSALLALAIGLAGLVAWMFAPLIVLTPGLLIFAAVAVEARLSATSD